MRPKITHKMIKRKKIIPKKIAKVGKNGKAIASGAKP